ncbi:DUF3592 domain-containing protein [Polyangium sp. 15x6]|uniref:DUF3592 domain-containing protein n=1 Tax=Polyangium sp. 15x6 TaxID=3042687 RepID=UPI00249A97AC|nr:DUF3592 domain-containing protein [Polyangium sp. 15x6]MDI3285581.1 DUF3592 domain-containing protein [Polyangium sp. 15x6]
MSRSSPGIAIMITVIGSILLVLPWVLRSQAEARAERLARMRTFSEATCTLEDIVWGDPNPKSGKTRVSVDYRVHVPGQAGTFVASGFSWEGMEVDNAVAAAKKLELLPGKRVPCWYDPAEPTDALLVQARAERPPSVSLGLMLGLSAVGLLFAGAGIGTLRTKKRGAGDG